MEKFNLSLEQQKNISSNDLANIIFKILKRNFSEEERSRGYYPGSLSGILKFELCFDPNSGKSKIHPDFEKKYYRAVQTLKDKRLIMQDHEQESYEFVELTEEGEEFQSQDFFPLITSSDQIIQDIERLVGRLDDVVKIYLKEAIDTFQSGHTISSAFCLGIMSERLILLFSKKINDSMNDPQISKKYLKFRYIKDYWQFVKDNYKKLKNIYPKYTELCYELDVKIEFLFQNYRLTRNEVGHPDFVPNISELDQQLRLKTVPGYIETIHKIIQLI